MTTPSASDSVVVDSSGWVEYLGEGPKAAKFSAYIEGEAPVLVPTVVLYEVYKKLRSTRGEGIAERFVSHALRKDVIRLDENLALASPTVSMEYRLAMADAIIYATARAHNAQLITSDLHFQGLPGVTLI